MKKLLLTLNATEYLEHTKQITVAVPDDCEGADLSNFGLPCLDSITEHCEWQRVEDSEGMDMSDDIEIEEADPADSPDVWLRWGREGLEEYDPEEECNAATKDS